MLPGVLRRWSRWWSGSVQPVALAHDGAARGGGGRYQSDPGGQGAPGGAGGGAWRFCARAGTTDSTTGNPAFLRYLGWVYL